MHKNDSYGSEDVSQNALIIHRLFEQEVTRRQSSDAIIYFSENASERMTITYGDLNRKANQLAHYLISEGVKPNTLVGVCIDRSPDLIIALLAILKAGGAYLPIDLSYPEERLTFMLEDANTSLLLTQRSLAEKISSLTANKIYIDEFNYSDHNTSNPEIGLSESDLAYVIYTSGSTGKPNGVMVTHRNVVRLFRSTQPWFNFNENDIWTFFHSYAFDFSVWEIWGALLHGGRLVIIPYMLSRSPEWFYDILGQEKVTVLNQTPSAFYQLIQAEDIKYKPDQLSLRYVIFGGEALNPAALKPWFRRHGDKKPQLINMYGITETTVHVTYRPLTAQDTEAGSVIGIPIPDVQVYILDESLNPVKAGEYGEIYVGGAGLSKGYLNRPELNEKRFIKSPFSDNGNGRLYKTGDLGRLLENNDIEYLGRLDHQVKIRGFRIELGEIESTIRNYKGIRDCLVKVHKYSEDVVSIIAYLVSEKEISTDKLKEHLKHFLPEYMIPNAYYSLDKIPLTPNGKADLKALPLPEQFTFARSSQEADSGNDDIENRLRQIWIDLLGYKNIGINDNFFDVGGNSLLMGRLQLRVNKEFQDNISIVDLFQYPTISSLSDFLNKKEKTSRSNELNIKSSRHPSENDIAIIGMSAKYPGADNLNEFWQNLINGVESISFFTDEELEYVPKGNLNSEIKFVKARGYLKDVDQFDAEFFGFNPREAAIMDPQHRIFLECAWAALEDAGYSPEKYKGSVGIFAGSSLNTYLIYNVLKDREAAEEMVSAYQIADYTTLTGNDNAFLTTKIAYKLGLNGPAINVQTACSTSLVAIEQAYQSLISGQSDMALAGGVSITFPQKRGYFFVDGSIGSIDGHCKPFDADATGTVFSHGAGIVVLKRLKDAIKAGDSIYAVIKAVAVNNDGSAKAGYMTPSVEGQSEVILKAQRLAGIDPSTIRYVETHGTGTPVGDPIEVASLEKAFREATDKKQFCGIGSVKSNLGHTDAAAGVTGLIKTALALHYKLIPPTLHYKNPNPRIDFANSPFYVVDKLTNIRESSRPLRAAVSAFGVGGTNAHAILEEFPEISFSCEEERDKYLIIVSGKTENSLNGNMNALKDYLINNPDEAINDVAYTLQTGRKEFEWRQFFVNDSCVTAAAEIDKVISSGINKARINAADKPQLVFMFPGQGAQYVNMGKGLYLREKVFSEIVDKFAEYLIPLLGLDIRTLLFPKDNSEEAAKNLEQTVYTQPALFIIEYALAQYLLSIGVQPAAMIGHSVGDYAAACLAGVFTPEDALYIIAMRARLMQKQEPGSMLSVRLNESAIKDFLDDDISLAAVNSPNLSVLSGPTDKVQNLSDKLSELKIENRMLYTSHAYHSAMMEPAIKPFLSEFHNVKLNKPTRPFISSMTGTWITGDQATDHNFWASQIRNTVRFSDGILELQKKNNLVMIELGPGRALSTMASQHRNNNIKQTTITTLIKPEETVDDKINLLNAVGKLWLTGIKIDWNNLYKGKKRRRLHLPAYQFDRKSYWIEAPARAENRMDINQTQVSGRSKKVVKKPKTKKVVQQSNMTRKEYIVDILKGILEELSGINKSDLDSAKSFFELGFDSLFMTQVSLAFQKKFEVKITLRQLLDTAPNISAIADYIDNKLAGDKFNPPANEIVIGEEDEEVIEEYEESTPMVHTDPGSQAPENSIEKLIQQQMELMRRQLDILQGKKSGSVPEYRKDIVKNSVKSPSKELNVVKKEGAAEKAEEKKVFERFGPYNPIKTNKDGTLTPEQQKYLNNLITDYTSKTKTSKNLTQKHRAHYSDPRTVSGFLPLWKEMTYQVITNKSEGSKLWDLDGNEYIDVIMGFGQYMFGHNPRFVRDEIEKQLKLGFEIGPQSPIAGEVARLICEFTGLDRAAFCVTGSEAVLGAIRAARTVTGKDKIIFFAGDYHGIIDEVLIKTMINGDQVRTMPIAPGIPKENVQNTIALEYGTEESLRIIENLLPEIGGIMVEPVQARRPDFQPKEFLQKLRKITEDANIPLIFDEVITGFRSAQGGAQEWFGIKADIGTFGKVIGGGFPIGVIAGKKLYMDSFDGGYWQYGDDSIPEAGVTFFAGTFARHPLSLTACKAVLTYLKAKNGDLQRSLNQKAKKLTEELNTFLTSRNVPIRMMNFSSVIYYSHPKDLNYFSLLFYVLRHKGIHILEGFPMFLSEAHSDKDIQHILEAFKESVTELQDNGFFPAPLNNEIQKEPSAEKRAEVINDGTRIPLSEAQKEMWIGSQMRPEAAGPHHACTGVYLNGPLNVGALKTAIQSVINRHEGLRCTISEDGSEAILNPESKISVPIVDLSNLTEQNQEKQVNEILHKEAKRFLDLSKGPLIEFQLVRLSAEKHVLIMTAQMIVCDGWSHYVVFEDLSAIYNGLIDNSYEKPEPSVSMRKYNDWEKINMDSAEEKQCEEYWLSRFSSIPPPIDLPSSKLRPSVRTYNGTRKTVTISKELYSEIKRLGAEQKSSSFAVLFAAFYVWLYRLSENNDLVVGVPFAAQSPLGMDRLIGQCANTLPLRIQFEPDEPFSGIIRKTWNCILDAQENWNFSYSRLVSKLNIPPDPSRIPLVSILFNIDPPMDKVKFKDMSHKFVTGPRYYFQYDLGFNLVEDLKTVNVECDYNPNLFESKIIEKWAEGYISILEELVKNPDYSVNKVPFIIKKDTAPFKTAYSLDGAEQDYVGAFRENAYKFSENIAVKSNNDSLTYFELDERSDKLCSYLGSVGINTGSIVGIYLDKSIELVVTLLAVIKSGGTYLLIDTESSDEQLKSLVEETDASIILTEKKLRSDLERIFNRVVCIDELQETESQKSISLNGAVNNDESLFCLIVKDNTPDKIKISGISKKLYISTLYSLRNELSFSSEDVVFHHSHYSTGYEIVELLLPLIVGTRIYIEGDDLDQQTEIVKETVEKEGITTLLFTPSIWNNILKNDWEKSRNIKALSSGEYLQPYTAEKLVSNFSESWNLYGTVETGIFSMINKLSPYTLNTLGRPIIGRSIILADKNLAQVPAGKPGEIMIGSDQPPSSRFINKTLNNENIANISMADDKPIKYFRTGDIARYNSKGDIEFLSSVEKRVRIKGFHFEVRDIEKLLLESPFVKNAFLTQQNGLDGELYFIGYIWLNESENNEDTKEISRNLRRFLLKRVPAYMIPDRFVIMNDIPVNKKGRLNYQALPVPEKPEIDIDEYAAPKNETEKRLVKIFEELLKISKVSTKDSFFDLGGQSLLAVKLFNRIEEEFGQRFPLATLFRAPTVEELAFRLNGEKDDASEWLSLIPIQTEGSQKPLYLVHGAGGNVLLYKALAKDLGKDYPLYGLQSRGLDGITEPLKTVEEMAEHYLEEIRKVQPTGPYYLGGYCLGGTIAYEMAQRLLKLGEKVGLVAMLDTYNFNKAEKVSFRKFMLEKFQFHFKNFTQLKPSEMYGYLKEKKRLAGDGGWANIRTEMPGTTLDDSFGRAESGIELTVQTINDHAGDIYIPKPYKGRLTLFKPQKNYSFYSDPKMGWGELVKDLDIIELPVNPHAMLVEPYVKTLAQEIKKRINGNP